LVFPHYYYDVSVVAMDALPKGQKSSVCDLDAGPGNSICDCCDIPSTTTTRKQSQRRDQNASPTSRTAGGRCNLTDIKLTPWYGLSITGGPSLFCFVPCIAPCQLALGDSPQTDATVVRREGPSRLPPWTTAGGSPKPLPTAPRGVVGVTRGMDQAADAVTVAIGG
jgi:hypothetical protein